MERRTALHNLLSGSFAWLTGYGELLRTLLRRELRARYQGSALGLVWSLLFPLAMMGVYTLVFSVLWRGARNIPHYPLFVLAGLAACSFAALFLLPTGACCANHPEHGAFSTHLYGMLLAFTFLPPPRMIPSST